MWQIVYSHRGAAGLKLVASEASALDAACEILDAGGEIDRIEISGTGASIDGARVRQIWKDRVAAQSGAVVTRVPVSDTLTSTRG
jgi:hypothetical protein